MIPMRWFILWFLLLLAGCSSFTTPPPKMSLLEKEKLWQQHQIELAAVNHWLIEGRLGVSAPDRSGSMSIDWQQQQDKYTIYLEGPFGQSLARIKGGAGFASVRASDGEEVFGSSPENLLGQLTGWDFPVSSLKFWVKALPAAEGKAEISLNAQGYPERIRQQGWQIDYLNYQQKRSGLMLPTRIKASNGLMRITLAVRTWQLK